MAEDRFGLVQQLLAVLMQRAILPGQLVGSTLHQFPAACLISVALRAAPPSKLIVLPPDTAGLFGRLFKGLQLDADGPAHFRGRQMSRLQELSAARQLVAAIEHWRKRRVAAGIDSGAT